MNDREKLNLDRLLQEHKPKETTQLIQKLKHSQLILKDVNKMMLFHKKYSRLKGTKQYRLIAIKHCQFIYNNYTNIFNRLLKKQLNLETLKKFLYVLKLIENKKINQHEGSRQIGMLLKNLYIDSVLKEKSAEKSDKPRKPKYNISWSEWATQK